MKFGEVSRLRRASSKALALHIKKKNMESMSFPSVSGRTSSSFNIARRYAKHRERDYLEYGERGGGNNLNYGRN